MTPTAALYCRKSNEEVGKNEDSRSVTRQQEHGIVYAERKGWRVDPKYIYCDDGVSGALFGVKRPGLAKLLNALDVKPLPFTVLVMSEESRLGREQIETSYILKSIIDAGVRVFYYLEDREATLTDATGKLMESVRHFAAEVERERGRQHTVDALKRKARAGHVGGGRTFAYENRRQDGHVIRVPIPEQAAVIKNLFEMYAAGRSLNGIARHLNQIGAPAPSKSGGWSPATWTVGAVREALKRQTYRGTVTTRWGTEVISTEIPGMRIIPEPLWQQVQRRLAEVKNSYLRSTGGRLYGRPASSFDSHYLLTSMLECASCSGTMTVRSRKSGRVRSYVYQCQSNIHGKVRQRRAKQCQNNQVLSLPAIDAAILTVVESTLLREDIVVRTVKETIRRLHPERQAARRRELELESARLTTELRKLTEAIARGGELDALLTAVTERDRRLATITQDLDALTQTDALARIDLRALESTLKTKLADVRGLLRRNVTMARQVLGKLILGRIRVMPVPEGYLWTAVGRMTPLLSGLVGSTSMVAPTGFEPVFQP